MNPPVKTVKQIRDLLAQTVTEHRTRAPDAKKSVYFIPFSADESQSDNNKLFTQTKNLAEKSAMRRLAVELYNQSPAPQPASWTDDQLVKAFNDCKDPQALLQKVAAKAPTVIQYDPNAPKADLAKKGDTVYVIGHGDATVDYIASASKGQQLKADEVRQRMTECFPQDIGKVHLNNCGASVQFQDQFMATCKQNGNFTGVEVVAFGPPPAVPAVAEENAVAVDAEAQAQVQGEEQSNPEAEIDPNQPRFGPEPAPFKPGERTELLIRVSTRDALNEGMRTLRPAEDVSKLHKAQKNVEDIKEDIKKIEAEIKTAQQKIDRVGEEIGELNAELAIENISIQKNRSAQKNAGGKVVVGSGGGSPKADELLRSIEQKDLDATQYEQAKQQKETELATKKEDLVQANQKVDTLKTDLDGKSVRASYMKQKKTVEAPDAHANANEVNQPVKIK